MSQSLVIILGEITQVLGIFVMINITIDDIP